jgi:SAM-dependent methyltransferase
MRDFYDARWERVSAHREHDIFALERPRSQIELAYQQKNGFVERLLTRHFPRPDKATLLETGCGRGTTSLFLAKRQGVACTLLDFSHPAVRLAAANFADHGCPGRFVQGDVYRLPFPDGSFDAVLSVGLLEHFREVEPPIREMARVTRPGGLFISYNAPAVPIRPLDRASLIYGVAAGRVRWVYGAARSFRPAKMKKLRDRLVGAPAPPRPPDDRYRNAYPPGHYQREAERAGLTDVQVRAVEPFPMFRPVPRVADAMLARLFGFVLTARGWAGSSEPYVTRLHAGRGHFLWGTRPA